MRILRRHPTLLPLTVAASAALGVVAVAYDWSELALYAAMTALIFVLALWTVLLEVRARGPAIFGEQDDRPRAGTPHS
jgi:hypothetical protein